MKRWSCPGHPVQRVGLAGAGRMGRCMLEKLLEANFSVSVYDKYAAAVESAVALGATASASPRELAERCDMILMSLPGPAQIEEVVFGTDGLTGGLTSGQVVVDTSTVAPATTRSVSERLAPLAVAYLDCPILGRPSAAGMWMLPTGGIEEALAYVRPALSAFASKAVYIGASGSGNALKLLNQMMFSAINAISSEVMAIAEHVGVDKKVFYETVANSSAATVSGLFKEVGKNIVADDFDHPAFTVDLLIKDTRLALEMAKDAHAPSVIAGTVQMYNEIASAYGLGGQDTSALYKIYQRHYREENDPT